MFFFGHGRHPDEGQSGGDWWVRHDGEEAYWKNDTVIKKIDLESSASITAHKKLLERDSSLSLHLIIVADCCYSGVWKRKVEAFSSRSKFIEASGKLTFVATCSKDQEAYGSGFAPLLVELHCCSWRNESKTQFDAFSTLKGEKGNNIESYEPTAVGSGHWGNKMSSKHTNLAINLEIFGCSLILIISRFFLSFLEKRF